jgi:hypothetical protein
MREYYRRLKLPSDRKTRDLHRPDGSGNNSTSDVHATSPESNSRDPNRTRLVIVRDDAILPGRYLIVSPRSDIRSGNKSVVDGEGVTAYPLEQVPAEDRAVADRAFAELRAAWGGDRKDGQK